SPRGVRPRAEAARRLLFLPPSLGRVRLQAAESFSSMDGAPRRARSRGVVARLAVETDRAARHARHSSGTLPEADALHESGMANGGGYHRITAASRRGRSGEVRLRSEERRVGKECRSLVMWLRW